MFVDCRINKRKMSCARGRCRCRRLAFGWLKCCNHICNYHQHYRYEPPIHDYLFTTYLQRDCAIVQKITSEWHTHKSKAITSRKQMVEHLFYACAGLTKDVTWDEGGLCLARDFRYTFIRLLDVVLDYLGRPIDVTCKKKIPKFPMLQISCFFVLKKYYLRTLSQLIYIDQSCRQKGTLTLCRLDGCRLRQSCFLTEHTSWIRLIAQHVA